MLTGGIIINERENPSCYSVETLHSCWTCPRDQGIVNIDTYNTTALTWNTWQLCQWDGLISLELSVSFGMIILIICTKGAKWRTHSLCRESDRLATTVHQIHFACHFVTMWQFYRLPPSPHLLRKLARCSSFVTHITAFCQPKEGCFRLLCTSKLLYCHFVLRVKAIWRQRDWSKKKIRNAVGWTNGNIESVAEGHIRSMFRKQSWRARMPRTGIGTTFKDDILSSWCNEQGT